jgi:predicted molibdopterin-dependent oxidoreductase YjgC
VFGAGGGTSSYREVEAADAILLWGSNAREAHPIYFHHVLKALDRGARMFAVDPRRTSSAKFADLWLGLDVGTDIALANTMARHLIANGLVDKDFIAHATVGFDAFAASVEPYSLEVGEALTGVPASAIAEAAEAYARAERAQILWTLGITEHHNAVDNVLALCNLALLTGHVGRWGSGLVPLRGQNNVQGGGDMGALPNRLPGFQLVTDPAVRDRFEVAWGRTIPAEAGKHLTLMFEAMASGEITTAYIVGENPADSEADVEHARTLLRGLDLLVVQDIFLTRTAELADVVLPASVGWAECDGTVTSSERRVQRVRPAVTPPGEARHDHAIVGAIARAMGADWWGDPSPEELWDELRSLSPMHGGMRYDRLEELGGIQWPCPDEGHPGTEFLHGWLWEDDLGGHSAAPFSVVAHEPPKEALTDEFPLRLTTGRALDSFNTGVQSGALASPIRYGHALDVNPADATALGVDDGEWVVVTSPRGAVEMPIRLQPDLPRGLTFTTFHFPELVDTNVLTNDAWDPKSGTAEFKAAAIRIDKRPTPGSAATAAPPVGATATSP